VRPDRPGGVSKPLRTVCAWCGRVRTGTGKWRRPDSTDATGAPAATHGICADCLKRTTAECANPR
jgi:hypothetical protein